MPHTHITGNGIRLLQVMHDPHSVGRQIDDQAELASGGVDRYQQFIISFSVVVGAEVAGSGVHVSERCCWY